MLRKPQHDAVVAVDHLDRGAELFFEAGPQRHRPRGVHLRTKRRVQTDPPVADFVAETFDDQRAIIGDRARRFRLFIEVPEQVVRCEWIEADLGMQPLGGVRASPYVADELAHGFAEFDGASGSVAVPERHLAGNAGRGGHDDAFEGDLFDPPARRAE